MSDTPAVVNANLALTRAVALLRALPYTEYLTTEHWQSVRYAALAKHSRCQLCGRHDTQRQVHHVTYEHRGREWAEDVIVLCPTCHTAVHGRLPSLTVPSSTPDDAATLVARTWKR